MTYAQIENTYVVNVIAADAAFAEKKGLVELPAENFGIGDRYIDGEWVKTPEPTPEPETDTDTDVWDAMAAAYSEGVQQA